MNDTQLNLQPHLLVRVQALLDQPLETTETLLKEVANHARAVEIVAKRKRPRQLPLSQALLNGVSELLRDPRQEERQRHLVQAAARYFAANQAEEDHDLASDSGLNDDAEVFMAIARALNRADLADLVGAQLVE